MQKFLFLFQPVLKSLLFRVCGSDKRPRCQFYLTFVTKSVHEVGWRILSVLGVGGFTVISSISSLLTIFFGTLTTLLCFQFDIFHAPFVIFALATCTVCVYKMGILAWNFDDHTIISATRGATTLIFFSRWSSDPSRLGPGRLGSAHHTIWSKFLSEVRVWSIFWKGLQLPYILLVGNLRVIFLRKFCSLRMFWGPYKWYWDGPWTLLCPPRPIWSLWNRYPHPRDHLKASHRPRRPPKCGKISIFRKFDFSRFVIAQSQKLYWKSKL